MSKTATIGVTLATLAIFAVLMLNQQPGNTFNLRQSSLESDWQQFLTKCNKQYSKMEKADRLHMFVVNRQAILDHNSKSGESYQLELNCFADQSTTEFAFKQLLGTKLQSESSKKPRYIFGSESLPDTVDWRSQNAVTPIKNQGQCGSCWAFSAIGSLEGLNAIKNGKLASFSEQQLVDCSSAQGNQGCNGGLMDQAFVYTASEGITTEDQYPYKGADGTCTYTAGKKAFQNTGHADVPANSSTQFQLALSHQPVSVAIQANTLGFQLYKSGVFTGKGLFGNCGTQLDHGVLAVGYGTDSGKKYYLVKNSWGASWGLQGYIEMENNGDGAGVCGIQMQASYPTL